MAAQPEKQTQNPATNTYDGLPQHQSQNHRFGKYQPRSILYGRNKILIEGEDKEDKIRKLLKQRDPVYTKFADVEMITGDKPFEDLIGQLEEKLKTCVKNS